MHEHLLGVLVSVSGTNDALQQSVAKAKSTTHANWGCLTRPFISILSVHLRQEYLLFVTAGLLTYPVYCAFPTMKSVAKSAINTQLQRDLQQQVLSRICTGFP